MGDSPNPLFSVNLNEMLQQCLHIAVAENGLYFVYVQTFVRLTNLKSKQEIIFVSEADGTLTNKFDLVSLTLTSPFPLYNIPQSCEVLGVGDEDVT